MKSRLSPPYFLFGVIFLFALFAAVSMSRSATQPASAQSETQRPPEVEAFMERYLADQQPPQNLSPLAETPCVGGMAGTYPCENVDLLAFMPLATIGGGNGNDVWGWTDPLDNKEYAIMGRTNGSAFVDITDPVNPIYLGNLPTQTSNSTWRDIKVYNNYAFIVSEASGHGMQVFDLTRLRNVVNPPVTFTTDAHYNQFGNAHNVAINEDTGFAYAIGTSTCNGGLHMVNIQNPLSPTNAGCFSSDGYTHDTQCVVYSGPDTTYQGHEICFSSNEDSVTIVDVDNKAAPVQLFRFTYSGSAYTHQGWLTEDQHYFLFDDELDEQNFGHNTRTRILDVTDLNAPTLVGFYDSPVAAIDHNLYTLGNYAFEANYRSGLRIVDLTNIATANMTQEGYFDIYPGSDSASFNGAWSVFPYYESGVVVVSGIEQGLFILRPTSLNADFILDASPNVQNVCIPNGTTYDVTIGQTQGFSDTVTLSASGVPAGYSGQFGETSVIPPATTVFTLTNSGAATAGTYDIDIIGTAPTSTHTTTVQLNLFDAPATATTLLTPVDGDTGVVVETSFSWTAVSNTVDYYLEVATDMAFANLVYTTTVAGTSHTIPAAQALDYDTTYYWRVTAQNSCGGTASGVFSFTTAEMPDTICRTPALPIADNTTNTDDLNFPTGGNIVDLNLSIDATHTWVGDVSFSISHNGTTVVVIDRPGQSGSGFGCSADNIGVELDDEGADGPVESQCSTTPPALFGSPTPNNPLSAFDGMDASGTWTIAVTDAAGGDTGVLNEWCLIPTLAATYGTQLGPDQIATSLPGSTVTYTIAITNSGDLTDTYDLTAVSAWTTTLSTSSLTLLAGEGATFEAYVSIPAGAAGNTSDVAAITATSQGDPGETDTTALTTTAEAVYGVSLSGGESGDGAVGSTVHYTLTITNTGNTTDTFDLSASGVWTATLPATATIAPGETAEIHITVDIPANASDGQSDATTVMVMSQGDNGVMETAVFTTTAHLAPSSYQIFLPIAKRN